MPEEPLKEVDKDTNVSEEVVVTKIDVADSMPNVGPSAMTPDHAPQPWVQPLAQGGKKKGIVIAAIITAAMVIVSTGGWMAYALWYQNPDKVVADAIVNAVLSGTASAEGSIRIKSSDGQSVAMKGSGVYGYKEGGSGSVSMAFRDTKSEHSLDLDIDGVQMADGTNYVRANDLNDAYLLFMDTLTGKPAETQRAANNIAAMKEFFNVLVQPTIKKVNNKWVKFSLKDLKSVNAKSAEQAECVQDVYSGVGSKPDLLIELGSLYQNNKIIEIKKNLGNMGNDYRFEIGINEDALKDFADDITDTKIYKELQDCSPRGENPLDIDTSILDDVSDLRIEVWIDQWTHQLHKIDFESSSRKDGITTTVTASISTKFNVPITVNEPKKDVIPFNEAFSEIGGYFSELLKLNVAPQSTI